MRASSSPMSGSSSLPDITASAWNGPWLPTTCGPSPGFPSPRTPRLAHQLAEAIPDLQLDALAHQREHSIEVQLPLLARLAPHARVVGIALGSGDLARCRGFAAGLAAVLRARKENPLAVISPALNTYRSEGGNRRLDPIPLGGLERLDPAEVYQTTLKHKISMCGLLPTTLVVLDTLRRLDLLHTCQPVGYGTEGIAPLPIRDRHRLDRIVLSIRVLVQEHGPSGEARLGRGLGVFESDVGGNRGAGLCDGGRARGRGGRGRTLWPRGVY